MKKYLIIAIFFNLLYCFRSIECDHNLLNRSCTNRPTMEYFIISPSEKFKIHYNNYYDEIDNFAFEVALAADSSRKVIVEELGFRQEISDDDGIYDIYISQLPNGSYGWNCLESDIGSSWIEIDDDYIGSSYKTSGLDAMRISVAHEFFHAIQRAYVSIPGSNSYFYELSSIWIEDLVYPDINDYVEFSQIGDAYFDDPTLNINQYNGYGLGLYGHYLDYKFSDNILERIWDYFSIEEENNALNAINYILVQENSSFPETWIDFNSRNIFNGINQLNNDIYYYSDQILFDPINLNILDIDDYFMLFNDNFFTHNFEFSTNSNNKSIDERSFNFIESFPAIVSFDSYPLNGYTFLAIKTDTRNEIINISNQNYVNTFNEGDMISVLNSSNDSFETITTSISKKNVSELITVDIFPNPIYSDQTTTLRIYSEAQINESTIDIYSVNGQHIKKINLGNFTYNPFSYSEKDFKLFNKEMANNIYLLKINFGNRSIIKKVVYIK